MAEDRKRLSVRFVKPGSSNASGKLAFDVQQKRFTPSVLTEFQLKELDIDQRTRQYLRDLDAATKELARTLTDTDDDREVYRAAREQQIRETSAFRTSSLFELVRETLDLDAITVSQQREWIESDVASDEFWGAQDVDECERALWSFRNLLGVTQPGAR